MKKYVLLALTAVFLLGSCSKTVNNWVYLHTEVGDFAEEKDSLAAVDMAKLMDQAAYSGAGSSAYSFLYNRAATMEKAGSAADAFYEEVKDTVTTRYSLILQKVISTSALKQEDQVKEPLRKYAFNME